MLWAVATQKDERHATALVATSSITVIGNSLALIGLTGAAQQTVSLVISMLAIAGVIATVRVTVVACTLALGVWLYLARDFPAHDHAHWFVNVMAAGVVSVVIAYVRHTFEDRVAKLNDDGQVTRTRLREQALELEEARDAAIESARMKSLFLANMSHEIRTPLNGIIGMLSLLRNTELRRDQQDYLDEVVRSSESLVAIVNDILDVSKIEAGALELELVAFDLAESLEEVATGQAAAALNKGVELILDVDAAMPRHLVGDPLRVRQVVVNLVSNAIKFTQEGEVVLSARILGNTETTRTVRISVADTGVGIAGRQAANHLCALLTGGPLDDASVRGHGPRTLDRDAARLSDGHGAEGPERSGGGAAPSISTSRWRRRTSSRSGDEISTLGSSARWCSSSIPRSGCESCSNISSKLGASGPMALPRRKRPKSWPLR